MYMQKSLEENKRDSLYHAASRGPIEESIFMENDNAPPNLGDRLPNYQIIPESMRSVKSRYSQRFKNKPIILDIQDDPQSNIESQKVIKEEQIPQYMQRHKTSISPNIRKSRKSKFISKIFSKFTGKIYLVKKFVHLLKNLSPFPRKASTQQVNLIQDYASDCHILSYTKKNAEMQKQSNAKILPTIRTYIGFTIDPQVSFLFFWELIKFLINLLVLYQLSLQLIFSQNVLNIFFFDELYSKIIYQFLLVYFIIDIIIGFKTGYYIDGEVVLTQSKVAQRYLKQYFITDAVTMIPYLINVSIRVFGQEDNLALKIINSVLFLKMIALSRVFNSIESRLLSNPTFVIIYRFVSVIGMVFIYAHIIACLWYLVGSSTSPNWLESKGVIDQPWYVLYSFSLYWSVMTMTTVGYGDIAPQNYIEALFAVMTMFIASIIFAYSVNTIGMILHELKLTERKIYENMAIINRYMRRKNLSPKLQFRVREYLSHIWKAEYKFRIGDEKKIKQTLPVKLQEEIQSDLFQGFIQRIPVFSKFSNQTIQSLIQTVQESIYQTKIMVCEQGSTENVGLYQIISGEAEMYLHFNDREYRIGKLKKGDMFGHHQLFFNKRNCYTVVTTQESTIAYLSHQDMHDILRGNPLDYQMYKMLVDQYHYSKIILQLGYKCLGCHSTDHEIDQCPRLHFQSNYDILIQKYLYPTVQTRQSFSRRQQRGANAKFGQQLFERAVSQLIQEYSDMVPQDDSVSQYEQSDAVVEQSEESPRVNFRNRSHSLHSNLSAASYASSKIKSETNVDPLPSNVDNLSSIINKNKLSSKISNSSYNIIVQEGKKIKSDTVVVKENKKNHEIRTEHQQSLYSKSRSFKKSKKTSLISKYERLLPEQFENLFEAPVPYTVYFPLCNKLQFYENYFKKKI